MKGLHLNLESYEIFRIKNYGLPSAHSHMSLLLFASLSLSLTFQMDRHDYPYMYHSPMRRHCWAWQPITAARLDFNPQKTGWGCETAGVTQAGTDWQWEEWEGRQRAGESAGWAGIGKKRRGTNGGRMVVCDGEGSPAICLDVKEKTVDVFNYGWHHKITEGGPIWEKGL